ncbi:MAG: cardiolipin synthase [Gemmataceae bacterium]
MLDYFWPESLSLLAILDVMIVLVGIPWILAIKRDSTAAVAWSLLVILVPILGFLLFVVFGYNYVYRPIRRKKRHRVSYRVRNPAHDDRSERAECENTWNCLGDLATRLGAFPVCGGNRVKLYHDGPLAFDDLFESCSQARHHIHLEYFIVQPDSTGRRLLDILTQKAREGVEVRLLYDAIGSLHLRKRLLKPLLKAGGKATAFFTLNPLRRRMQVNLRNHRKIAVIDGRVAFTGGLNIGDEYLGKHPTFGYWRDTHMRIEGPAVAALQRIFIEDWDFAYEEAIRGPAYYPEPDANGDMVLQILESGPDQDVNVIRETLFAAITLVRKRLWISTPYFVPDSSILDALRLAGRMGVDVKIIVPKWPDHWLPYYAARYYFDEMLRCGLRIYEYKKGMMHAKVIMADSSWATVGSANLDNRSLRLNFEVNCVVHSAPMIAELEKVFLEDLSHCERLDARTFAQRGWRQRLLENGCRLFSPML